MTTYQYLSFKVDTALLDTSAIIIFTNEEMTIQVKKSGYYGQCWAATKI